MTTLMSSFDLTGRVALVTGASSGLGVAFALALAEAGADVALMARRVDRLEQTADSVRALGRRALVVPGDVAVPDDAQRAVDTVVAELGRVDVLVNNAGVASAVPATRETPDQFDRVMRVNVNGSYHMAQACGRVMQPGSSVINLSSVLATRSGGLPQAAYAASKAAVIAMTRDLALQWTGRKGIRVNALAPGYFPSEMTDEFPPGYLDEKATRDIPAGRLGTDADLQTALLYLASDASSYVSGVTLPVDGGYLAG